MRVCGFKFSFLMGLKCFHTRARRCSLYMHMRRAIKHQLPEGRVFVAAPHANPKVHLKCVVPAAKDRAQMSDYSEYAFIKVLQL